MPNKEMMCPNCKKIWKGNIPEPRDKCFYERCQQCEKIVLFIDLDEAAKTTENFMKWYEDNYADK